MNWRTVGTIRHGLRHGESGQAFAELAVSLIAILAAFVGFLLIAMLGSARVTNLIDARKKADGFSREGYFGNGNPISIRRYDYGEDKIPYTADDIPLRVSAGNGSAFTDELSDNSKKVSLQDPPSSLSSALDFSMLQESDDFFLNAASLAEGKGTPLNYKFDDYNHDYNDIRSIGKAVQLLFGIDSVRIEEKVYMPAHKSIQERGD